MISSLDGKKNTRTFYVNEEENIKLNLEKGSLHSPKWWRISTEQLDTNYFKLSSSMTYKIVPPPTRDFLYFKDKIKYNTEWMKTIKEKAKKKGVSVNEMIIIDAEYMMMLELEKKTKKVEEEVRIEKIGNN